MREIKFRLWSESEKHFFTWNAMERPPSWLKYKNTDPKTVVQQYTGLKDKNGVEIYEGDILGYPESLQDGTLFEVRWARAYSGEQWCEFEIRNRKGQYVPGGKLSDFYGGVHPDYKVVIGNIFEGVDK